MATDKLVYEGVPLSVDDIINGQSYNEIEDAIKAYAKQQSIAFAEWIQGTYGWGNIAGKYYLYADTDIEYTAEQLYELYLLSIKQG